MRLGTHNGTFHADDVYAAVFLMKLYEDAEIIRSRDPNVLATCDIVFDVGRGKYDHHSRDKEYRENGIPYAASGLIWRDFGRHVLEKEGVSEQDVQEQLFCEIDEEFIQPLDAVDNGIAIEKSLPIFDISSIVRFMNPAWDSTDSEDQAFLAAVEHARIIFDHYLNKKLATYRAVPIVERAYQNRTIPQLVILERGCPWEKALLQLDEAEEVLYVISPRNENQYTIQAVPPEAGSFEKRKPFPDAWGGLEGKELIQVTGVEDAVFCHSGLWLAVAGSLEGAIRLATIAIGHI
jgi:uncharacterized UPF0160 family protein